MTERDLQVLKENDGKQVEIRCKDGEIIVAKVTFLSESEGDVICDLISTNRPKPHPAGSAISVLFEHIEAVRTHTAPPPGAAPQSGYAARPHSQPKPPRSP
jgi:hypothetical protein